VETPTIQFFITL